MCGLRHVSTSNNVVVCCFDVRFLEPSLERRSPVRRRLELLGRRRRHLSLSLCASTWRTLRAPSLRRSCFVRRHFGSSRDPSSRLEFPLHLPSWQLHQDSFRVRFLFACTSHGPCCLSPYHQVWEIWLFWILFALCGGIGYTAVKKPAICRTCGKTFRATERHSLRLLARRDTGVATPLTPCLVAVKTPLPPCLGSQAWSLGVIHLASNRNRTAKMQLWRTAQRLIRPIFR